MKKKGFSLVELMVTLVVVAVLIAALVPVITKRLKSKEITVGAFSASGSGGSFNVDCSAFSEKCSLCNDDVCAVCKETCAYNQVLSTTECQCKNCSDLFEDKCQQCTLNACTLCEAGNHISAGSCATCPAGYKCDGISRTQCTTGTYALEGESECKNCTTNCKECDSTTGECLVCEDNYTLTQDKECEVSSCGDLAVEISLSGQDMCVTKYNIGDVSGLNLPTSDLTIVQAGSGSCSPSATNLCCWMGTTTTLCDSNNGGYSGCTRTVCDWRAANKICENLTYLGKKWQLPTSDEWSLIGAQINSLSIGQGSEGLMLCDNNPGYSSALCSSAQRCSGSYNDYCNPYDMWSGTSSGSSMARDYYLSSGSLRSALGFVSDALSVRCISKK